MLRSRARLSRCIRALDTPSLQTQPLRRDGLPVLSATQQRSASSSTRETHRSAEDSRSTSKSNERPPQRRVAWEDSPAARNQKTWENRALRRPVDREAMRNEGKNEMWLGKRDPRMTQAEWDRRRKELMFLHDPLEVAAFVKQELAKGRTKEMLQLVCMASHSMQVIVSWNHIIDHMMKTNVNDAMKTYNDMKKRGQFPDSYTYTIVLRGLAENAQLSGIASKAIAVYHSMSAPNSRVQPAIIHTNAALTVCARSLDMDALWGFAAKIPEGGPGSADARTYTIILNAIRRNLLVSAPFGEGENELAQRRERGVVEGRRIWGDVVKKWRNADLVMEEELVCAMGRLLLVGSRPRDWDDVLSLVEQTMDIARLVPRLGTKERRSFPQIRAPNTSQNLRFDDDHLAPNQPPERGIEFTSLTSVTPRTQPLTFATPSNDTLSMILEACQKTIVPEAATDYWNLLTDSIPSGYGVVPDAENFHHRLRILRATRDSNAATRVLTHDLQPKDLKPGTFRLAMSTCVRDKNNVDALKNATLLLDLMMKSLPDADPKSALRYADLAASLPNAKPEDLTSALTHLHPVTKSLRLQLNLGTEPSLDGKPLGGAMPLRDDKKGDVVAALRRVEGVQGGESTVGGGVEEDSLTTFKPSISITLKALTTTLEFSPPSPSPLHSSLPNAKPPRHIIPAIPHIRLPPSPLEQTPHIVILLHLPPFVALLLLG
ncbi:hypothetical protein GRF29_112g239218 [Pseudopithomyces chartarum]|uniref:Pentatricopeptide repeat protein n=1 Tax=Pseudopithomyces chartarum TaxID=1892770 RepID=A0AAN6LVR5_9PLEO|nr:hypothetical protein GRF29_112g239218 [Pseudopithomyces chartarum]